MSSNVSASISSLERWILGALVSVLILLITIVANILQSELQDTRAQITTISTMLTLSNQRASSIEATLNEYIRNQPTSQQSLASSTAASAVDAAQQVQLENLSARVTRLEQDK